MRSLIFFSGLCLMLNFSTPTFAGNKEWATAGKILTGAIGVTLIADAINDSHCYTNKPYRKRHYRKNYYKHNSYHQNHHKYNHHRKRWTPGYYQTHSKKVWVPGYQEKVWIEPTYYWDYSCSNPIRKISSPGYYRYEYVKGHYEFQNYEHWVPGHWKYNY